MEKFENEYNLILKAGAAYVRPKVEDDQRPEAQTTFEKKIIEHCLDKISNIHPISDPLSDPKFADMTKQYLQDNILEQDVDRYSCKLCAKIFKGSQFVEKHIITKHADLIE